MTQFGYREGLSTIDALLCFTDLVRQSFEEGTLSLAMFLDLSKAFDSVPHHSLIEKIKKI